MAKYYAVRVGRIPGVYTDWNSCQDQVKGYSGAEFKSFTSEAEALAFVGNEEVKKEASEDFDISVYDCPVIFVDGSFNNDTQQYAGGFVVVSNPKDAEHTTLMFNGYGDNPDYISSRNVAGEVLASKAAMLYALNQDYSKVVIFHDYEGIAKWCNREWKANKPMTQEYKALYDFVSESMGVEFVHVKGHSNNYYNDLVDALAKDALGIPLEKKSFEDIIKDHLTFTDVKTFDSGEIDR